MGAAAADQECEDKCEKAYKGMAWHIKNCKKTKCKVTDPAPAPSPSDQSPSGPSPTAGPEPGGNEQDTIKAECQRIRQQAQAAKAPSARAKQRINSALSVASTCIQAASGKGEYWLKRARELRQQARSHWAGAEGAIDVDGTPAGSPVGSGSPSGTPAGGDDERASIKVECGALMARFQGAKAKNAATRQKLAVVQGKSYACMQALNGKGDSWLAQARQHRDAAKAAWSAAVAAGVTDVVEQGIQAAPAFSTGECQKACEVNFKASPWAVEKCKKDKCRQEITDNKDKAQTFDRMKREVQGLFNEATSLYQRMSASTCDARAHLKSVGEGLYRTAKAGIDNVDKCSRVTGAEQMKNCMGSMTAMTNGGLGGLRTLAAEMAKPCPRPGQPVDDPTTGTRQYASVWEAHRAKINSQVSLLRSALQQIVVRGKCMPLKPAQDIQKFISAAEKMVANTEGCKRLADPHLTNCMNITFIPLTGFVKAAQGISDKAVKEGESLGCKILETVEEVGKFALEKACKLGAKVSGFGLLSAALGQILPSWLASCPLKFSEGFLCSIPELLQSAIAIVKAAPQMCGPIALIPPAMVPCGLMALIKNAVPKIIAAGKQAFACFQRIGALPFAGAVLKSMVGPICSFAGGLAFDIVVEILSAGAATGGMVAKYVGKVAHFIHTLSEAMKVGKMKIAVDKVVESGKTIAEIAHELGAACGGH
jgi:hypothetical protein